MLRVFSGGATAGQRLHQIYRGVVGHGVAQMLPIPYLPPVDENRHVLPEASLVVEHVAARTLVAGKVSVKHVFQRGAGNPAHRALDVPLNAFGESDGRHSEDYS